MHPIIIYIVPIFFKGSKSCSYLYPPKNNENDQLPEATDGQFEGFRRIEHNVRKKLTETLNQDLQGAIVRQSLVAGGLCMALSYVNRYFTMLLLLNKLSGKTIKCKLPKGNQ